MVVVVVVGMLLLPLPFCQLLLCLNQQAVVSLREPIFSTSPLILSQSEQEKEIVHYSFPVARLVMMMRAFDFLYLLLLPLVLVPALPLRAPPPSLLLAELAEVGERYLEGRVGG